MKDGQVVNEEVKNADAVKIDVSACLSLAKGLLVEIDTLRNKTYGTNYYKDLLAARDYVMQCVGRLSLLK